MTLPLKPWQHTNAISPSASTTVTDASPLQALPIGLHSQCTQDPGLNIPSFNVPTAAPYGYSGFGSMPGYSNFGGYGGYGSGLMGLGGEQLWGGILGKSAESLGRLNNLLSMTGMLVEHVSNHSRLLYGRGQEFYAFAQEAKSYLEINHPHRLEQIGFGGNEDDRLKRRLRAGGATALFLILFFWFLRKNRTQKFENIFHEIVSK